MVEFARQASTKRSRSLPLKIASSCSSFNMAATIRANWICTRAGFVRGVLSAVTGIGHRPFILMLLVEIVQPFLQPKSPACPLTSPTICSMETMRTHTLSPSLLIDPY